ncbi:hypothetical protein POJ06DRAFT_261988 [Lipomyces tetrasporus]|uniref:Zn(2)-C6 fungal-type domain-containing protein n=1 Tax=Lipomyces tetrasporus TaxID=54092 RepID=A0AAD7VQ97_9ASCO|nr:uncharacterized protein POJ06DRAFT_261988 [Lipomyces tetrasporus]KAJ8097646.1 hypothetical protein POJ06DRAFT_261988 [Lipomyces tetrasporus]
MRIIRVSPTDSETVLPGSHMLHDRGSSNITDRGRAKRACDACKQRKVKCNGHATCQQCSHLTLRCTYTERSPRDKPRMRRGERIAMYRTAQATGLAPVAVPSSPSKSPSANIHDSQYFRRLLQIYTSAIYSFIPIVSPEECEQEIENMDKDPQSRSFLCALAAVTLAQTGGVCEDDSEAYNEVDQLTREALELRGVLWLRPTINIKTIMTAEFLHVCFASMSRRDAAFFYLREAITLAQVSDYFSQYELESCSDRTEVARRQRLFWLLFIHERFFAIHYSLPANLKVDDMPTEFDEFLPPLLHEGFLQIINVFQLIDEPMLAAWVGRTEDISLEWIQEKNRDLKNVPDISALSEMQQVDILITRNWLLTVLWKIAMTKYPLNDTSPKDFMSLLFPIDVFKRTLAIVSQASVHSLAVNGASARQKLLDLLNTVADIITVVIIPSAQVATDEIANYLAMAKIILSLPGVSIRSRETIQRKLANIEATIAVSPRSSVPH